MTHVRVIVAAALLAGAAVPVATGADRGRAVAAGPNAERVRATAQEVLSTPEFARLYTAKATWWRQVLAWTRDALEAIPGFFRGLPGWLFWLIFVWLVLALAAILAHLLWTLVQLLRGRGSGERPHSVAGHEGILGIRDLAFAGVYQEGLGYLEAGNWAQAMRYLYVAAILWLDSVGAIAFHHSKTDRDYERELARRPAQRARFSELTLTFECCIYGVEAPSEAACIRMADHVKALRNETAPAEQDG